MTNDSVKQVRVTDPSCTQAYPLRKHSIIVRGVEREFEFKFGEDMIMSLEEGLKFGKVGFGIEELDGSAINMPAVAKESIVGSLERDEVVAKLGELTTTALKVRAAQKLGGEMFLEASKAAKDDIIAFIIGEPPAGLTIDDEENLLEDDADEEIDLGGTLTSFPPAGLIVGNGEEVFNLDSGTVTFATEIKSDPEVENQIQSYEAAKADSAGLETGTTTFIGVDPAQEGADKTVYPETEQESGAAEIVKVDATFTLEEVKSATDEALELAVANGIDINDLAGKGTGKDGNILKSDVQNYLDAVKAQQATFDTAKPE